MLYTIGRTNKDYKYKRHPNHGLRAAQQLGMVVETHTPFYLMKNENPYENTRVHLTCWYLPTPTPPSYKLGTEKFCKLEHDIKQEYKIRGYTVIENAINHQSVKNYYHFHLIKR